MSKAETQISLVVVSERRNEVINSEQRIVTEVAEVLKYYNPLSESSSCLCLSSDQSWNGFSVSSAVFIDIQTVFCSK